MPTKLYCTLNCHIHSGRITAVHEISGGPEVEWTLRKYKSANWLIIGYDDENGNPLLLEEQSEEYRYLNSLQAVRP